MISYGTRLRDFKGEVVRYITEKVKLGFCRNIPGDIKMIGERAFIVHTTGEGTVPLDGCSVERICNIADKIHFENLGSFYPLGDTKKEAPKEEVKPEPKQEPVTTQKEDMAFEIKQNIPLPGHVFDKETEVKTVQRRSKHTNYRALPLKELKVGDCIIVHEADERTISQRFHATKVGVESLVKLMDTKKKFKVAKTDDFKVGVWRVE